MPSLEKIIVRGDGSPAPSLARRVLDAGRSAWRSFTLGPHSSKDATLARLFGGGPTAAGVSVNEQTAMACSAVFSAVTLIASDISTLPLHYFRRLATGGKARWDDHATAQVLARPNGEMGLPQVLDAWLEAALLWGTGYLEVERDGAGRPAALWPIAPYAVTPFRERGQLQYRVAGVEGSDTTFAPRDLLILRGPTADGINGHAVIQRAREAVALTMAAEKFGAAFFGNGASFGGLLRHPKTLGEKGQKSLRDSIDAAHRGADKAHRYLILEEGMDYSKIGTDPNNAQFLETRKFQIAEVCRFFHVPPSKLGQLEDANYSTMEQETTAYYISCIRPWVARIEAELNTKLVSPLERHTQQIEFKLEGFLRADTQTRAQFYATMSSFGLMTQNEIRALENLPPMPGGDQLYKPLNTAPVAGPAQE